MADVPDPFALVTATEAALYADVSVEVVLNWRKRGHLAIGGHKNGRPAYRLLDVAIAENKTRKRARRH